MALRRRSARRVRRAARRPGRRPLGVASAMRRGRPRRAGPAQRQRVAGRKRTRDPRTWTEYVFGKRRRVRNDPSGYVQWTRDRAAKKLGRLTLNKIVKANTEIADFLWKRNGRLDTVGAMWLYNSYETLAGADKHHRPVYICDLTSGVAPTETAVPVWRLIHTTDGTVPFYSMEPVLGLNSDGTSTVAGWRDALASGSSTSIPARLTGVSILKWSEIRADLWGAKNFPCEYQLTLCQIDPDVIEDVDYGNTAAAWSTLGTPDQVRFWDGVCSKLVFNPNERKVAPASANRIKVLDRRTYRFNPTQSTENDGDPHVKSIRLFYRMNRRCNWMWSDKSNFNLTTADDDPAHGPTWEPITASDTRARVHPKSRVYLMITCAEWGPPTAFGTETSVNTPSMHLTLYNRWIV